MSDKAEKLFNAMNKIDDGLIGSALDCDRPGKLNNAITNIDDDIIEAALAATPETVKAAPVTAFTNKPWLKWAAAVVAIVVIAAGTTLALKAIGSFGNDNFVAPNGSEGEAPGIISSSEGGEPDSSSEPAPEKDHGEASVPEENPGGNSSGSKKNGHTGSAAAPTPTNWANAAGTGDGEHGAVTPDDPELPQPSEGEFVKDDMPAVTYRINGEDKTFSYQKSTFAKMTTGVDIDGNGGNYVVDYYVGSDGSTVSKSGDSEGLLQYKRAVYSVDHDPYEQLNAEDALEIARNVVLNTDLPIGSLDSLDAAIQYLSDSYLITFKTLEGSIEVHLDKNGALQFLAVRKNAMQQMSAEKVSAAINKMKEKLAELNDNDAGGRYDLDYMHFEEWGNKLYAVFDVLYYTDKNSDEFSVYQYYCAV